LDAIWWRRIGSSPSLPVGTSADVVEVIANDSRAALTGVLLAEFRGRWVSHPFATAEADHKIVQLRAAQGAGLRTPTTLVSQDPVAIRRFCREAPGRVIAKPLKGTQRRRILTEYVTAQTLPEDASLSVSPVIYQHCVEGDCHLRVNCFGRETHAFSVRTTALDWRRDLGVPIEPCEVSGSLTDAIHRMLRTLGLRMGVFDFKVCADSGEAVFLEVNSQGQFLFLQGLCGTDLAGPFAAFLESEAKMGRDMRCVA
jgi:glutathione synthase/RimK-type ligase-like ATP-grasp enzyme